MRRFSLAIVCALASTPLTAAADDTCEGWFCDTPSALSGQSVSVELRDGAVMRGVVVEVAPDHVTIIVDGARMTLTWAQILTFHVVASAPPADDKNDEEDAPEVVVIEEKPAPAAPPPPPPPPPELVDPPKIAESGPFTLGGRLKLLAAIEDSRFYRNSQQIADYAAGGWAYELSFALRLNRVLFLRSSYEHAELFRGERNASVAATPTSDAVGIALRAVVGNTPDVRGVFEIGAGYRWLNVPYASDAAPDGAKRRIADGTTTYEGAESVRFALGSVFLIEEHSRFELLVEGAIGRFSHVQDKNAEARSYTIPEASRTTHAFVGISIGLEFGP